MFMFVEVLKTRILAIIRSFAWKLENHQLRGIIIMSTPSSSSFLSSAFSSFAALFSSPSLSSSSSSLSTPFLSRPSTSLSLWDLGMGEQEAKQKSSTRLLGRAVTCFPPHVSFPPIPPVTQSEILQIMQSVGNYQAVHTSSLSSARYRERESPEVQEAARKRLAAESLEKARAFNALPGSGTDLIEHYLKLSREVGMANLRAMASSFIQTERELAQPYSIMHLCEPLTELALPSDPCAAAFVRTWNSVPPTGIPRGTEGLSISDIMTCRLHAMKAPAKLADMSPSIIVAIDICSKENAKFRDSVPQAAMFAVDVSGSMGEEGRLKNVQAGLKIALNNLHPDDFFGVMTFTESAQVLIPLQRVGENVDQLAAKIDSMKAEGGTQIISPVRSLMLASAWFVEAYKKSINPVITLLTDCEVDKLARSELTAVRQAMENLSQSSAQNLALNVVAISVSEKYQPTLDLISSEMCGRKFLVKASNEIPLKMAEAAASNTFVTLALRDTELMIEGGNYEFEGVMHEGASSVEISSDKRIASGIGTKPLLASLPNKPYARTIYAKFNCTGYKAEPFALRMRLKGDSMLGSFDVDSGTQSLNPQDVPTSSSVIEQGIRYASYRFLKRSALGLMNCDSRDSSDVARAKAINTAGNWEAHHKEVLELITGLNSFVLTTKPDDYNFASSLISSLDYLEEYLKNVNDRNECDRDIRFLQEEMLKEVALTFNQAIEQFSAFRDKLAEYARSDGLDAVKFELRRSGDELLNKMIAIHRYLTRFTMLQNKRVTVMNALSKTRTALSSTVVENFHRTCISFNSECLIYTAKRFRHAYAPMSPQMAGQVFTNLNTVPFSVLKPLLQTHPLHNQLQDLTSLTDSLVELTMGYLPELFPFIVRPSTQALKMTISYPMSSMTGQLYAEHVPFYVQINSPGFVKIAREEAPSFLSAYTAGDIEAKELAEIMQAHGLKQLKKSEMLSLTQAEFLKRTHLYLHNISGDRAEYLLANKPEGSWIIRPSSGPGKYTPLTLKHAGKVEHYRLYKDVLHGLPELIDAGFDIDIGGIAKL